ncbi:hypothetical protein OZX57_01410 [Bifidobacterium sp. ESL0682]|uniref:hypothetical protein n=1 Tax=Bifidobacterium sp. ESL0682 TaxID=2983212 RepID=UPI0023F6B3AD|nr:hypothetical protein [Bifidobacterium sp. ESL0682]WEV42184.1 hypothetical protein OZX57_01410 [Bifidobacterium sp. ESL0682]
MESELTSDEHGGKDTPPPAEADVQTVLPNVGGDESSEHDVVSDADVQPFWKRRVVWIAAIAVVVVAVAGIAGAVVWSGHAKDEALADCRQYTAQVRKLNKTSLDNKTVEATKVDKNGVADVNTWEALQRDQKKLTNLTHKGVTVCDATSRKVAQKQESEASSSLESLKSARKTVENSAKAVLASRDAKVLKDVRDSLTAKVGQAKQLLDSSAGNVADENTRTVLSQQIDAANGMLGNGQAKLTDLQQAAQSLDGAVSGANASVQAKTDADAQVAAQQAQSIQTTQSGQVSWSQGSRQKAPAQSSPSRSSQPSQQYASSGSASSGSRVPSGGAAPGPQSSQPQQSTGNSGFDLSGSINPNCVAGHTGVCPIG